MRWGYSNLLSETIDAASVEYGDCRNFQIVCPACREPVFKALRAHLDTTIHYLSHYQAAKAYAAECELRVGRFDPNEIEQQNIISRGQKLKLFLNRLPEVMIAREFGGSASGVKVLFKMLNRQKTLRALRDVCHKNGSRMGRKAWEDAVLETATFWREEWVGAGYADLFNTKFSVETQNRIATDVILTIYTPAGRALHDFMWNYGYAAELSGLRKSLDLGIASRPDLTLRGWMERLVRTSRERGDAIVREMAHTPTPDGWAIPGNNFLDKMCAEVSHQMIGALIRQPYFEILRGYTFVPATEVA